MPKNKMNLGRCEERSYVDLYLQSKKGLNNIFRILTLK